MKTIKKTVVAGILIFDKNKVLLLKRTPLEKNYSNEWELPSGKVENAETLCDALNREIFEETGLNIKKIPRKLVSKFGYTICEDNEKRITLQKNYLIKIKKILPVKISSEHCSFCWASVCELNNLALIKGLDKVIKKSVAYTRTGNRDSSGKVV